MALGIRQPAKASTVALPAMPSIAVVIPVLNEERFVETSVSSAWDAGAAEVIVADGGSTDSTRDVASRTARVVSAKRGRASQMNAGAAAAKSDVLVFLHADCRLPRDASARIREALADPEVGAGAFRMRICEPGLYWRLVTQLARARDAWMGFALGDRGIFARREVFERMGGFREVPILEDADFTDRSRRFTKFRVLRSEVRSSARRWRRVGRLRTSAINWAILVAYRLGVRPERLAALYR